MWLIGAILRAISDESESTDTRSATSMPSSTRSTKRSSSLRSTVTIGFCFMNAKMAGASVVSPRLRGAEMRTSPRGSEV